MACSLKKTFSCLLGAGLLLNLPVYVQADDGSFPFYSSVFDYCVAVRNADHPDTRRVPGLLPEAALKQIGVSNNSGYAMWRCMNSQVWACLDGANISCGTKADPYSRPKTGSIDARGYSVDDWTLINPTEVTAAVQPPLQMATGNDFMNRAPNEAIVTKGDTLFTIARETGTSVNYLKQLNGLTSNTIYVGQHLLIRE